MTERAGKQREVFMLQLVLGGSGSGKTTLLYHRIRARAEAGQKSILLVPEQFTSSTEGRIYRELGDALSGMVESFSFTSLAEKILSVEGGAAVQTFRTQAALCWCAAHWRNCRKTSITTTATGGAQRSARWPPRPSTSSRARACPASSWPTCQRLRAESGKLGRWP